MRKGTSSSALKDSPPHRHSKPTGAVRGMMQAMRRASGAWLQSYVEGMQGNSSVLNRPRGRPWPTGHLQPLSAHGSMCQ